MNPKVLSASGIPLHYASSGTCIAAVVASLMVGIMGNLPVGCAPGVGLSAYFSYGLMAQIEKEKDPSTQIPEYCIGLAIQLIAGAIVLILTLTRVIPFVIRFDYFDAINFENDFV